MFLRQLRLIFSYEFLLPPRFRGIWRKVFMCGIYAAWLQTQPAQTKKDAGQKVFEGIKRIEYRGYDSWGVAVLNDGQFAVEKSVGQISKTTHLSLPAALVALGHTRWATHGGVTLTNAHPHLALDKSFALVHNGVVENYAELKTKLEKTGRKFTTQTDTEVIVALVEQLGEVSAANLRKVVQQLAGRSTVAILTNDGQLFAFRLGSPLVVGKNSSGDIFLSSDTLSVAKDANQYYLVNQSEIVWWDTKSLHLFDAQDHPKKLRWSALNLLEITYNKGEYAHFMLKEIYEQSEVLIEPVVQNVRQMKELALKIKHLKNQHVWVVGAGSAFFAAQYLSEVWRQKNVAALAVPSYDGQSFLPLVKPNDLVVALSQSGETADTNMLVTAMQERGAKVTSLVNMAGSSLTAMSDWPFALTVGPEIGVASTKALLGMMVWGWAMGEFVSGQDEKAVRGQVEALAKTLKTWLKSLSKSKEFSHLLKIFAKNNYCFVLGRGETFAAAKEYALKLKEVSYLKVEGMTAGELKHGPIALIEKGTPVFCLANQHNLTELTNAAAEVKARGAVVIGVAPVNHSAFDIWLQVPLAGELTTLLTIIPAQLLCYQLAVQQGFDPDKPRNLAKSVTVV